MTANPIKTMANPSAGKSIYKEFVISPKTAIILSIVGFVIGFTAFNIRNYEQTLTDQIQTLERQVSEERFEQGNSSTQQQGDVNSGSVDDLEGLSDSEYLSLKRDIAQLIQDQYSLRTNLYLILIQVISGLVVFASFFFTWQSQKAADEKTNRDFTLAEKRLINERFGNAVDQLGADKCVTRLGGMYALQSIAMEYPDEYWDESLNILAGFIQDRCSRLEQSAESASMNHKGFPSHLEQEEQASTTDEGRIPIDIQTCFEMLGKLSEQKKGKLSEINLRNTNLNGLQIKFKTFDLMMDFSFASIIKTEFTKTEFKRARFINSNLDHVCFDYTFINRSSFRDAIINQVSFKQAKLQNASFENSKIQETDFKGADLSEACFENARLEKVCFQGAILNGADFNKAQFINLDLRGTAITKQQLEGAFLFNTLLPSGNINTHDSEAIQAMQKPQALTVQKSL